MKVSAIAFFYIPVLTTSHQQFKQVPKTPAPNPATVLLITPGENILSVLDLNTSKLKKKPPVHKAYLNYIPKYPIYKPPIPLVFTKCVNISLVLPPLNLPSESNYLANLAFSNGEIVKISGIVAKAPAKPLVKGVPSDYF